MSQVQNHAIVSRNPKKVFLGAVTYSTFKQNIAMSDKLQKRDNKQKLYRPS